MSIAEMRDKCKSAIGQIPKDILIVVILILACLISFGLGLMAGRESSNSDYVSIIKSPVASTTSERVSASRNGTKFYYPWCSGVDRISDTNKVWFADASAAIRSGYTIAANCERP